MPQYTTIADVFARLKGKVKLEDPDLSEEKNEGRMTRQLANRLIDEAEGQVEQDLSPRYASPLQHATTGKFSDLPDRPTKNIIRTLAELQSVIRILETDFGSGTVVDAAKYSKNLEARYSKMITGDSGLLKRPKDKEDTKQFSYPPLPFLKLNYFNTAADDGYVGGVMVHRGHTDYATGQIDDAGEDFFNGFDSRHD